jgi:thiamine-phosphate pyrophosphorylase
MTGGGVASQLYLVLPATAADAALVAQRAAAASLAGPVATVLIEPDAATPPSPGQLADAVAAIQKLGIATLVAGDASLARVVKADGVHLTPSKAVQAAFGEARETLGNRFIVGADVGRSRDDAMTLGEAGADYIGFGIPAHVEDRATARDRRVALVEWWAEIFEVPCVAFDIDTPADADDLARAGADFLAVRLPAEIPADGIARHLAPYFALLGATATAAGG